METNKRINELTEALSLGGLVPHGMFERLTKGMPSDDVLKAFAQAKERLSKKGNWLTDRKHLLDNLARQRAQYRVTP